MPGLNNFRNGGAAPTTPTSTTYTGSYATTAQDARDKCQGNVVASVTRSATSTVSQVDATAKAKALALAAIVCPVFNASYQTTAQDYIDKCGAGTSGASVTGYGSSGKDQATADAAAKQDAINKITCPVPFPDYSTPLTKAAPTDPAGETTLTLGDTYPDGVFKFNANPGGDSDGKSMVVNINGSFAFAVDFPATYTNTSTPWTFAAGGHRYTGTYLNGTTDATPFD